jgi:hypothetical protein
VLYIRSRYKHFQDCLDRSKKQGITVLIGMVIAVYTAIVDFSPLVDFGPLAHWFSGLPKLPLAWAALILLSLAFAVMIEGSYRLRIKENTDLESAHNKAIEAIRVEKDSKIGELTKRLESDRTKRLTEEAAENLKRSLANFVDQGKRIIETFPQVEETHRIDPWIKEFKDWESQADAFLKANCSLQASITFMDSSGNLDVSDKFRYLSRGGVMHQVIAQYLGLLDKRLGNLTKIIENPQVYFPSRI